MPRRILAFPVFAFVTASALLSHAQDWKALSVPPAVQAAANSIDPERLRAHVRFLADDLLEGRGTGQRGGDIAAIYIASQFAQYGLKPAGDDGSYLQKVNFVGVKTDGAATRWTLVSGQASQPLAFSTDFVTTNQTATPTVDFDAPIVWCGYGIDAPEYNWDDYKGIDLHGKIAMVLVNEPPSNDEKFFKGEALTYYGRWTYKYEEAARRGAVGVLVIHRTDLASYPWTVLQSSGQTERAALADDPLNTLKAASWITYDTAGKIFTMAGMKLEEQVLEAQHRGFTPRELPVRIQGHTVSHVRHFVSNNVIAELPGANVAAGKPDAAVIYTGHYDHLGLGSGTGDIIYNGAADNGTGSAIVIEMARAWSMLKNNPPAHSIFFAAVTGEEQGLLGSKFLGMHPPVPAKQISLDLNFDELLPIGDAASADVSGAERTAFYPQVQKTAAAFGLTLQPDRQPMAGHYYRSDHFSFARVGVPAFSLGEGTLFVGHDQQWGEAQERDYNEHHYHQVSDEYAPGMDFRGNARLAKFGFILGWQASELPAPLGWQPGDEFGAIRAK